MMPTHAMGTGDQGPGNRGIAAGSYAPICAAMHHGDEYARLVFAGPRSPVPHPEDAA